MSILTVIPETQLSTFASSSSVYPSPSSPSSTQAAAPLRPEPNTQQLFMPEIDVGNDRGSGRESDTDLSDFESESSCSELAVRSHLRVQNRLNPPSLGQGPPYPTTISHQPGLGQLSMPFRTMLLGPTVSSSKISISV